MPVRRIVRAQGEVPGRSRKRRAGPTAGARACALTWMLPDLKPEILQRAAAAQIYGPSLPLRRLVGCFLGQPKCAQARRFLGLGLPWGVGLSFRIDLLCCLELVLRTPTACLARQGLGMHWRGLSSLQADDLTARLPADTSTGAPYKWAVRWAIQSILKQIYDEIKIIEMRKSSRISSDSQNLIVKFEIYTIFIT